MSGLERLMLGWLTGAILARSVSEGTLAGILADASGLYADFRGRKNDRFWLCGESCGSRTGVVRVTGRLTGEPETEFHVRLPQ